MRRGSTSSRARTFLDGLGLVLHSIALVVLAGPPARAAPTSPAFERHEHAVVLTALPALLDDVEVRAQLDGGLTTTFVIRVSVRDRHGKAIEGEAWVAARYELWDEIFLVGTGGLFAAGRRQLADFDALLTWWQAPGEARLEVPGLRADEVWSVRVDIDVIPFSRDEQRDAQRWLADSLAAPEAGPTESIESSTNEGGDPFGSALNLLLATSIRRDALLSRRFMVELAPIEVRPIGVPSEKHEP